MTQEEKARALALAYAAAIRIGTLCDERIERLTRVAGDREDKVSSFIALTYLKGVRDLSQLVIEVSHGSKVEDAIKHIDTTIDEIMGADDDAEGTQAD